MTILISGFFSKRPQIFLEICETSKNLHKKLWQQYRKASQIKLINIGYINHILLVIRSNYLPKILLLIEYLRN